jgi:hypothetical protein
MSKTDKRSLLIGIAWSGAITTVVALLTINTAPRWAVISASCIGFVLLIVLAVIHGWLKAPYSVGTPLRATVVIGVMAALMFLLGWLAWPPIRRHTLDAEEQARFEKPLKHQTDDRYEIQLACPSADESVCVYAAQFINLFREAGWKVQDNQVKRVVLGVPYEGIRIFSYVPKYPEPDAPVNTGVWSAVTPSLISVYRAFSAIGIESESGIRNDEKPDALTVYFGSERADESQPTQFTATMAKVEEAKRQYPSLKVP